MFRTSALILLMVVAVPAIARAQAASSITITLDEAERRALQQNPAIAAARLAPEAADLGVAESRAAYTPNFTLSMTQRSQTNPSTSQLAGGQRQVTNDSLTYGTGIAQRLPWGGSYSVDFNGNRSATSNVFSTFNPSFGTGLSASITQPLLRGFRFDQTRAQIELADIQRTIADVNVRRQEATTLNAVRRAYWELVYGMDAVETARRSEELARRNHDENTQRVALGTVAAIDVLESEAEVAARHQAVVQAEGAFRTAQVTLKQLMVKDAKDPLWAAVLRPVERPNQKAGVIDLPLAIANAMANRTDLEVARQQLQSSDTTLRRLNEERKPGVDLVASYALNGIGGTQVLRQTDALGGQIVGTVPGSYFDALSSVAQLDYPTWSVGLNVTLPIGKKASDAAYARGQVEKRQAALEIDTLQLSIAADVTRAAEQVRTAEEQMQAAASARQLAARRLEAEQARRTAGMSTNFQVLQAQRDLATAETSELRARLDYQTAVADFERVQIAP
jgi:outer membrane protein TolC